MSDLDAFRVLIEAGLGLSCEAIPEEQILRVLEQRRRAHGCADSRAYLAKLGEPPLGATEVAALAEQLTVGETYFFREPRQIDAFVDLVLPARLRARRALPVRILSAGCATGEEPYSLAIAVAERCFGLDLQQIKILGIDVNPAAIQKARRARYSSWAFRAAPAGARERCFVDVGGEAELRRDLRHMVSFEERNLLTPDFGFWQEGVLDAIFCRNVLIYLSRPRMTEVIERLTRALAPGGYLFLGHSESLRGISDAFETLHSHEAFYYRRRGKESPAAKAPVTTGSPVTTGAPKRTGTSEPRLASWGSSGAEPFSQKSESSSSSDRIAAVVEPRPVITATLALIKEERFSDALDTLSAGSGGMLDAEIELLTAVILSHQGKIFEAERICERALDAYGADAGVHYLFGLCREHEDDPTGAARHYRAAIRIDGSFAMPHLRLGRLLKRAGDLTTAWTELRRAADLFARERALRILLFGGGFQRAALVEVCYAELRASGGRK